MSLEPPEYEPEVLISTSRRPITALNLLTTIVELDNYQSHHQLDYN
jgi:hypothetical protein